MKLEEQLVQVLLEKGYTLTTVESCTGGLLMGTILNVSGASACVNEGYITYSNEAKERLVGVKHDTLETFGAVSEETAREMAIGGARVANADIAISVTGIAGPGGGTEAKPVGVVYIGCYVNGGIQVGKYNFLGNREVNRNHSIQSAIELALKMIV